VLPDGAAAPVAAHPLAGELEALASGQAASLPYFPEHGDWSAWFTLTPDADRLREAQRELRAWPVPSFSWADPRGEVVPPAATGALSPLLLALSPAGYLRWRAGPDEVAVQRAADRLRRTREPAEDRPARAREPEPMRDDLRQQSVTALAAGDHDAAAAVERIEAARLAPLFGANQLTDSSGDMPEGPYRTETLALTTVPNRNMILLAVALGWAVALKYDAVAFGAHGGSHTNYPDCRPEFAEAMDRREAFRKNGLIDPAEYENEGPTSD
jgi:hypothetical protein